MADPNCATLTLIHYHGKYISCVMDSVDGAMTTALRVALDRFIISYLPALTTLVTLSIALLGWSVVIGKNESVMLKQVVVALLMTGFIYAAIVNFEVIFKVVHPVITQAPAELAGYLIPGMSPGTHADTIKANAYGTLDRMAGNVISNCWAMIQQPGKAVYNGEYSLGTLVGGAILGLCALVYLAVTAGFLVMNHVRAAFLLLFAPLFISFLLFAKTRGMTQQWIQNLIATALTALFIFAVIALNAVISQTIMDSLAMNTLSGARILSGVLIMIAATVLISGIPTLARDIAGGIGGAEGLLSPSALVGGAAGMAGAAVGVGAGALGRALRPNVVKAALPGVGSVSGVK